MITSKSNPLIKQARALRERRERERSGLFVIEGIQQVGAAIEEAWGIEYVLFSPERLSSTHGRRFVSNFKGRVEEVEAEVFDSAALKEHPQGILAVARQRHMPLDSARLDAPAAAIVSPQDPGNVGAVLRTLDAVGGCALYLLDGGADPYHPGAIRASMGAIFMIPVIEATFEEFLQWRARHGTQLIGTSAHATTGYREARPALPWILLLGSEQKGLNEAQQHACDIAVSLPMRGRCTSLNLAVAAGILLFTYTSQ